MDQQIHFVTGKGGVGKSVLAAALALKYSEEGQRVLLVELGDRSFYQDFFGLPQVGFQATALKPNLSVALWTGQECLKEYTQHLLKVERLANLFFENQVMRTFLNVAPALSELAILGKITSGPRNHGPPLDFDCIVVDAFATGHFVALMGAPEGMAQVVQFGPMGEQSRSILKCIQDPEICHYHIVTLPEELPVKESLELRQNLQDKFSVHSLGYLNKCLQTKASPEELAKIQNEGGDLGKFAAYVNYHQTKQASALTQLQEGFKNVAELPMVLNASPWDIVKTVRGALS